VIVPGDPPCPEPKAAVNKVLFSITPEAVTEGISLAEDRLESVTSVERSLLRAVQQALTNMQLHAGGSNVDDQADGAEVRLKIAGTAR
jgi:hypothetical protein